MNEDQASSGTLTYAVGSGKATVSTPFFYAKEILADGRGMFCKFKDSVSIADCITRILSNHDRGFEMRMNTYKYGMRFIWPKVAQNYVDLIKL